MTVNYKFRNFRNLMKDMNGRRQKTCYRIWCIGFDISNDFLANHRMSFWAQAHITKGINVAFGQ